MLQLDFAYREHPVLLHFQWRDHEDLLARFKKIDRDLMAAYAAMVKAEIVRRQPPLDGPAAGQTAFLRRELAKQRRHAPLRKLFQNSGNVILGLTPCLLMSPLSVATFLAKDAVHFDVVVFDEASQMPAEDAMGAILRGDQLVVAGDPKQLPPTRFFERSLDADDAEDVEDDEPLESVLGDCQASEMQRCRLLWHYRSKHESLIAFSNAEFYENELITFPSLHAAPPVGTGVRLDFVADGVYDRGRTRTNRREAQRVAQLVERHIDKYGNFRTLGVIALSTAQEAAIEEEILRLLVRRPDLEPLLKGGDEPFFVKPLENVQGDERDTIIISVGYGRGPDGNVSLNFGPLNIQGGERRLNVAVTRARWELVLVSSIQAHDIDDTKTEQMGPKLLKRYLAFARDGRLAMESAAPRGESESPFEVAVWEAITDAGHEADRQVGCSNYRIDIAVKDPATPGRYLLGVECDGAMYHSSRVARDRDRLRQQVLEGHGWKIHRIWSTDWVRDRQGALDRLLRRIEALRSDSDVEIDEDEPPEDGVSPVTEDVDTDVVGEEPGAVDEEVSAYEWLPPATSGSSSDPYYGLIDSFSEMAFKPHPQSALYGWPPVDMGKDIAAIVAQEGPIHRELLTQRVARMFGVQHTGSNIADIISVQIDKAVRAGTVVKKGVWFWPENQSTVKPRRPGPNTSLRNIKYVPPEEMDGAAVIVAGLSNGISRKDLVREIARLLSYQRTGALIDTAVNQAIERLIKDGRLVESRRFRPGGVLR